LDNQHLVKGLVAESLREKRNIHGGPDIVVSSQHHPPFKAVKLVHDFADVSPSVNVVPFLNQVSSVNYKAYDVLPLNPLDALVCRFRVAGCSAVRVGDVGENQQQRGFSVWRERNYDERDG